MQGRATPVWLIASSSPCLTKQLHSKRQSHRLLLTHCCLCLQDCHPVRRRPLSEHCRRMGAGPVVRRPHHPQVHVSVFANCGSWLVAASICRDGIAFQAIFSPCHPATCGQGSLCSLDWPPLSAASLAQMTTPSCNNQVCTASHVLAGLFCAAASRAPCTP